MRFQYPHSQAEIDANQWEETDRERYDEMLGVLPPHRMTQNAFLVGEPLSHLDNGQATWDCYINLNGKFYWKPMTTKEFEHPEFWAKVRHQIEV